MSSLKNQINKALGVSESILLNGRRWTSSDFSNAEMPLIYRSTAIFINGFDDIVLKNTTITNVAAGIALQNMTGILVDGVTVYNASDEGVQIVGANNGVMKNSTINRIGYPSGVWHGIAGIMFAECRDFILQDSSIYDITNGGGLDGVAVDYEAANRNVTTTRCNIYDCDDAAFLVYDNGAPGDDPIKNNYITHITNNNIYNCGRVSGDTVPAFIRHYDNTNSRGVISGNRIKRYTANQKLFKIINNSGTTLTDVHPSGYYYCSDTIYSPTQAFPARVANPTEGQSWTASAGFSATKGNANWYYLDWNGSSYNDMNYDSVNSRWKGGADSCLVGADWQHPDNGRDSVRRWVAPASGVISITGTARMASSGGDGVGVMIWKNGEQLFGQSLAGSNTTGISTNLSSIRINTGDRIDFIINKNVTTSYDTTYWNPQITWNKATSWTASSDFKNIQGYNDWIYLRGFESGYPAFTYTVMDWDAANSRWKGDSAYCLVASNYQHPDTGTGRDSIRTWFAPRDGVASIASTVYKSSSAGDGVVVKVFHNNTQKYSLTITDTVSRQINLSNIQVKQGDTLRFVVQSRGTSNSDTTYWDPTISMP